MPEITFKGKEYVFNHHLSVPYRPLEPDAEKSIGEPDLNGNLIIHGDNLHALKALLPQYAGKVDCIFIDPPYNTGTENWCYNDNVNSPIMQKWLNTNPVDKEDMLRHDKWLALMWPRIKLLKELLHEDGLMFISIDDNEASRLQTVLDEIFGEEASIGRFVWKSRQNKDNRNASGLSVDHEYIFIIGKQIQGEERIGETYDNEDDDPRGAWSSGNMVGLASKEDRPNLHYDLINPKTSINYGCPPRGWRYERKKMETLISEDKILWPRKATGRPREKVFFDNLSEHTNVSSVIQLPVFTRNGTLELDKILKTRELPFPKPSELVEFFIHQHHNPNAIVLDSFAGSGTTAHAVLQANQKDGGNRKFILVECEDYADRLTAERTRRVINGYEFQGNQKEELLRQKITWSNFQRNEKLLHQIQGIENIEQSRFDKIKKTIKDGELIVTGEKKITERTEGLGGSFTYCTLGEPLDMQALLSGESLPDYNALASWIFHTTTGQTLDVNQIDSSSYYLGETPTEKVWMIYQPDLNFLKSPQAALTAEFAKQLNERYPGSAHLVLAPSKFMANRQLQEQRIRYAPLPFSLYRMESA